MRKPSEIAQLLKDLYQRRAKIALAEWQYGEDLRARQTAITPEGGWPGSNEKARETAREKVFAADETCQKISAQIRQAHADLATIEADLAGLEAERRGLEWEIRRAMIEAMIGVDRQGHRPVEEAALDDAAQAEHDRLWEDGFIPPRVAADYNDIPF